MLKTKARTQRRILILTSSGGVGHLQAANAKKAELLKNDPSCKVFIKDIFYNFAGKGIGDLFTGLWNRAKTKSNLSVLKILIRLQPAADVALFYPIYFGILKFVNTLAITEIIDTQNLGISAILKALAKINNRRPNPVTIEKILTDLPTEGSIHYFSPIKKTSLSRKQFLKIKTTKPLLKKGLNDEIFWEKTCGLPLKNIQYCDFPLRKSFLETPAEHVNPTYSLKINICEIAIANYISKTLNFGTTPYIHKGKSLTIQILKNTKLSVIMLGGYPNKAALLNYIQKYCQSIQTQEHLVCIFCNNGLENSKTLFDSIYSLVANTPNYPKNLSILPLTFQPDSVIMPLLRRSDATISRAGGITCMEILTTCKGNCWIHQEIDAKTKNSHCMPIWENGNASYLIEKLNAKFITPNNFTQVTKDFFQ